MPVFQAGGEGEGGIQRLEAFSSHQREKVASSITVPRTMYVCQRLELIERKSVVALEYQVGELFPWVVQQLSSVLSGTQDTKISLRF